MSIWFCKRQRCSTSNAMVKVWAAQTSTEHCLESQSQRRPESRLLIVACGMLVHSSSMAVWSCWILAGTETRCRIRRSRASQTCSMGDMSGEYAGHARTGMFSASRNCVQILATWGRALSCCNMSWWSWMNGTTMGLRISSRYLCVQNAPVFIVHNIRLPIPQPHRHHGPLDPQRWHQQTAHPNDAIHAVCHLPCTVKTGIHPWREHLSKVPDAIECEHVPTQVGYDDGLQSGRDPD